MRPADAKFRFRSFESVNTASAALSFIPLVQANVKGNGLDSS